MSETAKITEALVAFQAEMPTVAKSKSATVRSDKASYSYTYAGLAEVSHAALPLLTKHGLAFSCMPEIHERGPVLTGLLLHISGESLRGSLPIATGGTPQQTGSAITYARRYLFGCMTGLITDDDDDGQTAARKAPAKKAARSSSVDENDPWANPPPGASPLLDTTSSLAKSMYAAINKAGIPEEERIEQVSLIIGRPITSTKQMTTSEARLVLDHLKKQGAPA